MAARSSSAPDSANAAVNLAQDSFAPLGGSYLPSSAADCAYSFACPWIVSQGGGSCCSSLPRSGVSEFGPLASFTMICLIPGEPPPPGGPPPPGIPPPAPGGG